MHTIVDKTSLSQCDSFYALFPSNNFLIKVLSFKSIFCSEIDEATRGF